jgi:hypothetical protein
MSVVMLGDDDSSDLEVVGDVVGMSDKAVVTTVATVGSYCDGEDLHCCCCFML